MLLQYNPRKEITISFKKIGAIHKIQTFGTDEPLGSKREHLA